MLIRDLSKGVIIGYWLIGLLIIYMIVERWRFETGKHMFIDKFITYLEGVHRRTAPKDCEIVNVREYSLSDKVKVMELQFHGHNSDNREPPEKEDT
ncbi:hypothetical protein SBF1_2690002 [Candidatus Desulfosporosinus infrequens]|uniref:Uncharacterized protein n=1 Tax=Candidatus Desulfosporosinus infrequens TaxID=2043169 RepID=A0A2U3KTI0_9FIRM|nr:hypothetical protein SBF1_2690002 [Candidatus Desulfosporosinus infrequens]